jgi:hypothetical protein
LRIARIGGRRKVESAEKIVVIDSRDGRFARARGQLTERARNGAEELAEVPVSWELFKSEWE